MRITINLPEALADQLSREAAEAGLPPAEHIVHLLANRRAAIMQVPPRTGAELVDYWIREGVIGSRSDINDPIEFSCALRMQSQDRSRAATGP